MSSTSRPTAAAPVRIRVWDLPLRLFHWLLVLCVIGSFVSIKRGNLDLHFWFGYAALALLLFRLLWGLVGPRYARFASFLFSPVSVWRYLTGHPQAPRTLGHTPLGALSVLALLAILASQAISGLFVSDQIATEGPLARHVSLETIDGASWWHHLNERIILALVALHLLALVFYRVVRKLSLVKPMVVGDKLVVAPIDPAAAAGAGPGASPPLAARDDAGVRIRALVIAAVSIGLVAALLDWAARP